MRAPLDLEDLVGVRLEGVHLAPQVSQVPEGHGLGGWGGDKRTLERQKRSLDHNMAIQRQKKRDSVPRRQIDGCRTLSADPVAITYSQKGLKERQLTSALCARTSCRGLSLTSTRVSQLEEGKQREAEG